MRNGYGAVVVCAWLGSTAAMSGAAADRNGTHVILRLYSDPDLHLPWFPAAQTLTESIFAETGIRVQWLDCRSGAIDLACNRPPRAHEFVVRIRRSRSEPASHACGVSLRPNVGTGHYVTLFADCIRDGSDDFKVAEPIVAAYTMAHEVGHLLLPTAGHAPSGIMRARPDRFDWERARRRALGFRPAERQQIHEALRQRLESER